MSQDNPIIISVTQYGRNYECIDQNGHSVDSGALPIWMLKKAVAEGVHLVETHTKRGIEWRREKNGSTPKIPKVQKAPKVVQSSTVVSNQPDVDLNAPMDLNVNLAFTPKTAAPITETAEKVAVENPNDHASVLKFLTSAYSMKPKGLVMDELQWKYLVRSAIRGKNILMVGDSGSGKTLAAKCLAKALARPTEIFNLGATQDPRSFLIGNTHYDKEKGTFFSESLFVQMIRTPNAVIILDELSRAHPDAWNILMTVLDVNQRYLRLDEKSQIETVKVADGVTFIATANIGNQYTATRVLDQALFERFIICEMRLLGTNEEVGLLKYMYPTLAEQKISAIAEIAALTRMECQTETSKLSRPVSTRISVEMAGLMFDGFSLTEAAEVAIVPFYAKEGGADSERVFVKAIIQKFVSLSEQTGGAVKDPDPVPGATPLFGDADLNSAPI